MRWGFLGASRIGRRALAPAVLAAGHDLRAVAARDASRARAFADEFTAPHAHGDYAALLADPDIDAVYNALPNDLHLPWTVAALQAGKHVLCEKPLALNAAEVAAMRAAEQASGGVAMEAFCHLHHPQLARVKSRLAAGAIGRLVAMQSMFAIPLQNDADFRWHAAHGGGALFDLGCYCLSLMRDLAGEPGRVAALSIPRGDVDETFTAQLDFSGVVGQFTCSFAGAFTQHLELVGTAGRMLLDWPISTKNRETMLFHGAEAERFAAVDPYVLMLRQFERLCAGEPGYGLAWSLAQAQAMDRLFAAAS